ncbi:sickle tail protein homolog [Lethenteron reissneri]|uniref:sickle tail protein homolog n=1 Tax=Lethenteron reissneri TaxID=7753 RepID=UPI002AB762C2|nr:sickle tail protein homolog [Lethenteron reissneri]
MTSDGAAAAARPPASLAEHRPPAKDGAGARSKFKIKFPRKQLAALTSALRSGTRSGKKTLELVMDGDETSDGDGDGTLASMNPYAQVDGGGLSRRALADAEGADGRPRPENGAAAGRGDGPDDGPDDDGARWAEGATESEHPVTWPGRNGEGESPAGAEGFPAAGMVATASPEAARAKPLAKPKPPLLPKPSFAPEQPLQNGKSASSASSVPGTAEPTSQPSTPRQGQKAMRVLHSITSSVRQVSKSSSGGGGSGGAGPPTASPQRKNKA